jgi:hypothetical protein
MGEKMMMMMGTFTETWTLFPKGRGEADNFRLARHRAELLQTTLKDPRKAKLLPVYLVRRLRHPHMVHARLLFTMLLLLPLSLVVVMWLETVLRLLRRLLWLRRRA